MYNFKLSSFLLLVAILFGCALANVEQVERASSSTVAVHIFGSSSLWWLAVQPRNDNSLTSKVELKDGGSSSFVAMTANAGWGYYTFTSTSGRGFSYPLTLRLTSSSGSQITVQVNSIVPDTVVDTQAVYGSSASTSAPATAVPTTAPTTVPTTKPGSASTSAPTTKPTSAPTVAATAAPTAKPTSVPTTKPTTAPATTTDLCSVVPTTSEPMKLLVPLYVYPGADWDQLIAAASKAQIIAIINPNSGPLATVDSSYATYMTKMANAGITMVGYVHTLYGARDLATVKSEIDTYATKYPLVKGIFLDEAANDAANVAYYTQVYNHIMSKSGYAHAILNPGVQPDQGYLAISTNIVIFENYATDLASTSYSSFVKCAPNAAQKSGYKYKFSAIVHTAAAANQASYINTVSNMGMGLVYITDGVGGCCTYNTLTSYFSQEAASVAALN